MSKNEHVNWELYFTYIYYIIIYVYLRDRSLYIYACHLHRNCVTLDLRIAYIIISGIVVNCTTVYLKIILFNIYCNQKDLFWFHFLINPNDQFIFRIKAKHVKVRNVFGAILLVLSVTEEPEEELGRFDDVLGTIRIVPIVHSVADAEKSCVSLDEKLEVIWSLQPFLVVYISTLHAL